MRETRPDPVFLILMKLSCLRLEHLGRREHHWEVIGFVRKLKKFWVERLVSLIEDDRLRALKGSDPFFSLFSSYTSAGDYSNWGAAAGGAAGTYGGNQYANQ